MILIKVCFILVLVLSVSVVMVEMNFNCILLFLIFLNNLDVLVESLFEIILVMVDGMIFVYSDSLLGVIGLIDIIDFVNLMFKGSIMLDGELIVVLIIGNMVFVGFNIFESYIVLLGVIVVIDFVLGGVIVFCDLGGQLDLIVVVYDGLFVIVVIENECDEDLGDGCVGQVFGGYMVKVMVQDEVLQCDSLLKIDVLGLIEVVLEDLEFEFVDVNGLGEIVVIL